jgi:hypothetical protein
MPSELLRRARPAVLVVAEYAANGAYGLAHPSLLRSGATAAERHQRRPDRARAAALGGRRGAAGRGRLRRHPRRLDRLLDPTRPLAGAVLLPDPGPPRGRPSRRDQARPLFRLQLGVRAGSRGRGGHPPAGPQPWGAQVIITGRQADTGSMTQSMTSQTIPSLRLVQRRRSPEKAGRRIAALVASPLAATTTGAYFEAKATPRRLSPANWTPARIQPPPDEPATGPEPSDRCSYGPAMRSLPISP